MTERSWTCPHCRVVFPSGLHAYFCPEKDYPIARAEQAEAAIARVREIHRRYPVEFHGSTWDACSECENDWPCDTIRALDGGAE